MMNAIDHLIERINEKTSPIVVGMDPLIHRIPKSITTTALKKFGNTPRAATEAIYQFNASILEAIHPWIPAVKLQMACYELYGAVGVELFERTVKLAKKYNLTVMDDSKRNDIGSTAKLYAMGHLGEVPLIEGKTEVSPIDFLTINPYLGQDGISPFIEECQAHQKGIFILVKTSNPSAKDYQDQKIGKLPLFHKIASDVHKYSQDCLGKQGYSSVGAVVGATWEKEANELRVLMPQSYFLVPGFGVQGGSAKQITATFNPDGYGAIINSSRGIIFAWEEKQYQEKCPREEDFAKASLLAVQKMRDEILQALKEEKKLPSSW